MKRHLIQFVGVKKAEFCEEEFDATLPPGKVLVKMEFSVISAGTELANYCALPNSGPTGYSSDTTHLHYPFVPGYSFVGIVKEIGEGVTKVKVGDRVQMYNGGHRSWLIRSENDLVVVPDSVSPQEAAFAYISVFPCLGVRKLEIQLGESVMVAGLGLLGLFAVQMARLSGAYPVLACDYSEERRNLALKLGADFVFNPADPDFISQVKVATEGQGPAAVVEVTGRIEALQQALEYIAFMGRVSLLGCTRVSDKTIDYYTYVHKRGITLIGSHSHTRPKLESRPGAWTVHDDICTFMKLVSAKRLQVAPLIGRVASPRDAASIYEELLTSKTPVLGVVLDWRDIQ